MSLNGYDYVFQKATGDAEWQWEWYTYLGCCNFIINC